MMTYKINLAKKQQEREDKKKKSITLKAITKEEEDVEEKEQSEEDDYLALITRKLNKYMRGERFRGRILLKMNLHPMVTRRNGKRKEI